MSPADLFATAVLLVALDCPRFETRQAADVALRSMGERALPALMLQPGDNPEARRRVDSLIEATLPARIDRLLASHKRVPRLDALPREYVDRWQVLQRHLPEWLFGQLVWGPSDCACFDDTLQDGTRQWIVFALYNGKTFAEVASLFDSMAAREAACWDGACWTDEPNDLP